MDLSFKICSPTLGGPEGTPFTMTLRNKSVTGTVATLKSFLITFVHRPENAMGTAVTELGKQNAAGVIGSWGGKSKVAALSCPRQGGHGSCDGKQSQSRNQSHLTHRDLWHWVIDHGVSKS